MSPLLLPAIPLVVLVVANAGVGACLIYYLSQRRFNGRGEEVKADALALGIGFCAFAILLGLMIAFDAIESNPGLDTLTGLGAGLKFGMAGIFAGQVVALVAVTALSRQLFEKKTQVGSVRR
jgi:hypothetical protein